jgi:hypothetical protein
MCALGSSGARLGRGMEEQQTFDEACLAALEAAEAAEHAGRAEQQSHPPPDQMGALPMSAAPQPAASTAPTDAGASLGTAWPRPLSLPKQQPPRRPMSVPPQPSSSTAGMMQRPPHSPPAEGGSSAQVVKIVKVLHLFSGRPAKSNGLKASLKKRWEKLLRSAIEFNPPCRVNHNTGVAEAL